MENQAALQVVQEYVRRLRSLELENLDQLVMSRQPDEQEDPGSSLCDEATGIEDAWEGLDAAVAGLGCGIWGYTTHPQIEPHSQK